MSQQLLVGSSFVKWKYGMMEKWNVGMLEE
jgi:hypothetical protein